MYGPSTWYHTQRPQLGFSWITHLRLQWLYKVNQRPTDSNEFKTMAIDVLLLELSLFMLNDDYEQIIHSSYNKNETLSAPMAYTMKETKCEWDILVDDDIY